MQNMLSLLYLVFFIIACNDKTVQHDALLNHIGQEISSIPYYSVDSIFINDEKLIVSCNDSIEIFQPYYQMEMQIFVLKEIKEFNLIGLDSIQFKISYLNANRKQSDRTNHISIWNEMIAIRKKSHLNPSLTNIVSDVLKNRKTRVSNGFILEHYLGKIEGDTAKFPSANYFRLFHNFQNECYLEQVGEATNKINLIYEEIQSSEFNRQAKEDVIELLESLKLKCQPNGVMNQEE